MNDETPQHKRNSPHADYSTMTKSELEFELFKSDPDSFKRHSADTGAIDSIFHLDFLMDAGDQVREDVILRYGPVYGPDVLLHAFVSSFMDARYRGDIDTFLSYVSEEISSASEIYQEAVDLDRKHITEKLNRKG